ncbi:MAG: PspC domain-containing protein [Pygmaiobacter sp.]
MEPKRLCKDRRNEMLCGVCAGLADYAHIDVTIVRLLAVLLGFTGSGILIYLIAAVIMPYKTY